MMEGEEYRYRHPFVSPRWSDLYAPRVVERWHEVDGFQVCRAEMYYPPVLIPNRPKRIRSDEMVAIMVSGKNQGGFKGLDTGVHVGVCDLIADLGVQETNFGPKHKVYVRFSVPDQEMENKDGERFQMSIGSQFTASLSPKANLRKMLESWRGMPFTEAELEAFDLSKLLGKPATLVVGSFFKDGEERAKLDNVIRCKNPTDKPLLREPMSFGLDSTDAELENAPQWIREKIQEQRADGNADDEAELEKQHAAAQAAEDDIPF